MAEVIRRALDEYLDDPPDPKATLTATFGADPDRVRTFPRRVGRPWLTFWWTPTCSSTTCRGAVELKAGRHRLHYSVITRAELFAGSSASEAVTALLGPFREIEVDRAIAERAGRVRRDAGVRLPDALIAATALEHGLEIATRNTKDFKHVRGARLRTLG